MADDGVAEPEDELDAFFSAAGRSGSGALLQAAESVAGTAPRDMRARTAAALSGGKEDEAVASPAINPEPSRTSPANLEGKFIAVDAADTFPDGEPAPFVLVPAHIHSFLPWWGWLTIAIGLLILIGGVMLMPVISLNRLVDRLDDRSEANVQAAMRLLILSGDERTVEKLYDTAFSGDSAMTTRLRAVDTLALIRESEAERALLRLELAGNLDAQVREAAIAARKQREAAKTGERGQ